MKIIKIIKTKLGEMTAVEEDGYIKKLCFGNVPHDGIYSESEVLDELEKQLNEYFSGTRKEFSLPLMPDGTDFQKKVWKELEKIKYGQTKTYEDIASALGNKKAARAVGGANNKNPIAIIIPCHRVIGKNGNLVGYAGGLDIKRKLLEIENNM